MPIFLIPILQMVIKRLKCISGLEAYHHLEDIEELQEEMVDRFGEYPEEVEYYSKLQKLKFMHSRRCGNN